MAPTHRAMPCRMHAIIAPVFELFNSNVLLKGATRSLQASLAKDAAMASRLRHDVGANPEKSIGWYR